MWRAPAPVRASDLRRRAAPKASIALSRPTGQWGVGGELHEVPQVSVKILEDRHRSVRLTLRLSDELDALGDHRLVVPPEIVGAKEQEDAPSRLATDERLLLRRRRSGKKQRRSGDRKSVV